MNTDEAGAVAATVVEEDESDAETTDDGAGSSSSSDGDGSSSESCAYGDAGAIRSVLTAAANDEAEVAHAIRELKRKYDADVEQIAKRPCGQYKPVQVRALRGWTLVTSHSSGGIVSESLWEIMQ